MEMDWQPTTPPLHIDHGPYSQPRYIPGGWPVSPPRSRSTNTASPRKRKSTFAGRVAKRVCTGMRSAGAYVALPVQPLYAIVRSLRRWQSRERRRPTRDPVQFRRVRPGLRARIEAAENYLKAQEATSTEPANIADSDTTVATGLKRKRAEEEETANSTNCEADQHQNKRSSLTSNKLPMAKRARGVNRFDTSQKKSSATYAGRGVPTRNPLKPIGARTEGSNQYNSFFGGWAYERPIEPTLSTSPIPSQQTQSELEDHTSETEEKDVVPDTDDKLENSPSSTNVEAHDERWSSSGVPSRSTTSKTEIREDSPEQAQENTNQSSSVTKPFHWRTSTDTPPPIRNRVASLRHNLRSRHPTNGTEDLKAEGDDDVQTQNSTEITAAVKKANDEDIDASKVPTQQQPAESVTYTSPKDESSVQLDETKNETILETPMKAIAEEEKHQLGTPEVKTSHDDPETPADGLAKLRISDNIDRDTPKATPHSGTKTTRITRYREAIEKAQRAKLEQYELVAISKDWDDKVRIAVREGISSDLPAQALARVVPQYAGRGQDNWLNDETISKYLELIAAHGRKNDRPDQVRSHHAFNNYFYNNLRDKGVSSVSRWSKRAKIGGKNLAYVEKVFVPINSGAHWTLAVVEPTQKKITHYNSMRGTATGTKACTDLKAWVAMELGKDFKEEEWTLTAVGESPQQTNSDDCGVFTITSARQIMLGYTPMSYGPAQIPNQRIRIVAELLNDGLLKSSQPQ